MHTIQHEGWTLVHKETGKPVVMNEVLRSNRTKQAYKVKGGTPPHKPSSTGRVWVDVDGRWDEEFFPTVFDLKWVNEIEEERMAVIEYAARAPGNDGLRTIIRYKLK